MQIKSTALVLLIAMAVTGCAKNETSTGATGEPVATLAIAGDPALVLVTQRDLGANLEQMANQVARSTHTYGMVAEKYGASQAPAVIARQIRALLPNYQDRWNENLAASYSAHLSQDELRSLATLGSESPYAQRFLAVRGAVSSDMKTRSEPLLNELVTKALVNAVSP